MRTFRSENDDDLQQIILAATEERDRRYAVTSIPGQIDSLNRQYLMLSGRPEGVEWFKPENAYEAYPHGWKVQHNGENWVSLRSLNEAEPGDGHNAWGVVVPDEGMPEWVKPTGDETRYSNGALVLHSERHWISRIDQNGSEPGEDGDWDEFDEEAEFAAMRAVTPPEPPEGFRFTRTQAWAAPHPVPPGMPANPEDESPFSATT